jgi:hypothetical protein
MALTALALVAPGDTITAAQQNIVRTNFGVLDARTGGDPGSSGLLAVSNGAASVAWTDDLVAVLAALGYTPANKAGDTFTGSILATGDIAAVGNLSGATLSATGQVTAGQYAGGTTSAGSPQVKGLTVGTDGIVTTGTISPAAYVGGSTATGTPNVKGLNVGTDGIASTGVVNPAAYAGALYRRQRADAGGRRNRVQRDVDRGDQLRSGVGPQAHRQLMATHGARERRAERLHRRIDDHAQWPIRGRRRKHPPGQPHDAPQRRVSGVVGHG